MQQGQVKVIGNYSYNLKHCLGEGAYGKVYQGLDTTTNLKVAIKKLDLRNFERDNYLKQSIIQEIEILKKFNHKNIVKFIDLISTQRSLYIITEFCKDGDLREIMSRKKYNEQDAWKIMKQIIQGFRELVSNAIIHRDLKPANILSHEGVFKIADFGFAKYVDNFTNQLLRSCVGSPLYMAPQILARKPYSTKCDIWSLGVIFYEMVFTDVPWKGRDERDLLKNILSVPVSIKKGFLTSKSEEFLRKTLTIEENDRISWEKVFEMFEVVNLPSDQRIQTSPNLNIRANNHQNSSNNEKERKKSIFQGPSQPPVQQTSAPVSPISIQPQTPSIKSLRNEIIFRNFVLTTELFPRYTSNKNSIVEKVMICLSKTNMAMQNALYTLANQIMVPAIKKDHDQYVQFHSDLIETLQRNGQLQHCDRELDINSKDQNCTDTECDKLNITLTTLIKQLCQEMLEEHKRAPSRPIMLLLDNLVDIIIIHKKVQRCVEIDYDQLNAEKAEEEDPRKIMDAVIEKLRQA
ncbi:unnamed protein product (macronuclear) [Paramecium tetraurelia]|uniref:Protein kinase domain-containing protein n=1 Tax=Paramecium tetraurelia TaxID=5888 RepID=A0BIC2_PARTE|nr:uncharacterized protein GSPATT00004661001 [Paramecium tetraurelia]CAK58289.1 unnamed protein product [Paramecium tetraurelia]|eukprot:XP_001425687.1 hypothetical protein (macronuclear) [Paramecium tetraurelia strain d4-2]